MTGPRRRHAAAGPHEDFEAQWRTTKTHTADDMMGVYRQLFFAGLPEARFSSDTSSTSPAVALAHHRLGAAAAHDASTAGHAVYLPAQAVRHIFAQFGDIAAFEYDERRGIGAVTFANGTAAEDCFLCTGFSCVDHNTASAFAAAAASSGSHAAAGHVPSGGRTEDLHRRFYGSDEYGLRHPKGHTLPLLWLEFAEYLPFVNTGLLHPALLPHCGTLSRQFLRTFPRRRAFDAESGSSKDAAPLSQLTRGGVHPRSPFAVGLARFYGLVDENGSQDVDRAAKGVARRLETRPFTQLDLWYYYFHAFVACDVPFDPVLGRTATAGDSSSGDSPPSKHAAAAVPVGGGELPLLSSVYTDVVGACCQGTWHLAPLPDALPPWAAGATFDVELERQLEGRRGHRGKTDTLGLLRSDASDAAIAFRSTMAYVLLKMQMRDDPGLARVHRSLQPPEDDGGDLGDASPSEVWPVTELQALIEQLGAPGDEEEGGKKGPALPALPEAAINALYRGQWDLKQTLSLFDHHCPSGSKDALLRVCGKVTAQEIRHRAGIAQRGRVTRILEGLQVVWGLFRVPLLVLAATAVLVAVLVMSLGHAPHRGGGSIRDAS